MQSGVRSRVHVQNLHPNANLLPIHGVAFLCSQLLSIITWKLKLDFDQDNYVTSYMILRHDLFTMRLQNQDSFPRRWHGVLKFSRAPRELKGKLILFVKKQAWFSNCVLIAPKALLCSLHCILPRSYGVIAVDSSHSHNVFTVLARRSWYTQVVFPRRSHRAQARLSGTALT